MELNGKTLGVIGCGRIGQVVSHCAKALGMRVLGYDPVMSKEAVAAVGIQRSASSQLIHKHSIIPSFQSGETGADLG